MLEEKIEKDKNRKKENKKLEEKIEMVRIEKDKNKYKAENKYDTQHFAQYNLWFIYFVVILFDLALMGYVKLNVCYLQ